MEIKAKGRYHSKFQSVKLRVKTRLWAAASGHLTMLLLNKTPVESRKILYPPVRYLWLPFITPDHLVPH